MSALLLAPLSGAFVSATLFYAFRHTISTRTELLTSDVRACSQQLTSLSRDHPPNSHAQLSSSSASDVPLALRASSLKEGAKAVWNAKLESFVHGVESAQWGRLAGRAWDGLTSQWRTSSSDERQT